MFVLAADDVTQEELQSISAKIQQKLEKWAEREDVSDKKQLSEAKDTKEVGPSCKRQKLSPADEACELVVDVDERGRCSFNVVSCPATPSVLPHTSPDSCNHSNTTENATNSLPRECDSTESNGGVSILSCKSGGLDREDGQKNGQQSSTRTKKLIPSPSECLALDCEFVGVGRDISALGRCSIVDFHGKIICDLYAQPNEPITTYRTRWSGLTRKNMMHAIPVNIALKKISDIIKGKVVIGHAVYNDFRVMGIQHPQSHIRDTQACRLLKRQLSNSSQSSLKIMCKELLDRTIQNGRHCSVADARAAMDLYKLVRDEWETMISEGKQPCDPPPGSKKKASTNGNNESSTVKSPKCCASVKNNKVHFGQMNVGLKTVGSYFTQYEKTVSAQIYSSGTCLQQGTASSLLDRHTTIPRTLCHKVGDRHNNGGTKTGGVTEDGKEHGSRKKEAAVRRRKRLYSAGSDEHKPSVFSSSSLLQDEYWPDFQLVNK